MRVRRELRNANLHLSELTWDLLNHGTLSVPVHRRYNSQKILPTEKMGGNRRSGGWGSTRKLALQGKTTSLLVLLGVLSSKCGYRVSLLECS